MMIRVLQAIVLTMIATNLHACPTCVGRITQESAPFFSDELYQESSDTDSKQAEPSSTHQKK